MADGLLNGGFLDGFWVNGPGGSVTWLSRGFPFAVAQKCSKWRTDEGGSRLEGVDAEELCMTAVHLEG